MDKPYRLTFTDEDGTYGQGDYTALYSVKERITEKLNRLFTGPLARNGKITITVERNK